jgi:hypothetical protein
VWKRMAGQAGRSLRRSCPCAMPACVHVPASGA